MFCLLRSLLQLTILWWTILVRLNNNESYQKLQRTLFNRAQQWRLLQPHDASWIFLLYQFDPKRSFAFKTLASFCHIDMIDCVARVAFGTSMPEATMKFESKFATVVFAKSIELVVSYSLLFPTSCMLQVFCSHMTDVRKQCIKTVNYVFFLMR